MIAWLKNTKVTSLILLWVIIFCVFLPSPSFAATIPYTITTGVPGQFTNVQGQTFLTVDFDVDYQTGQIMFSSNPDGTGNTAVDDAAMIWVVERPDGSSVSTTFRYDNGCRAITPKPPLNVSALFKPGINKVQIRLFDVCGVVIASSPLYLVNTNAPEPPPTKTPLILIPGIGGSELKIAEDISWSKDNGHGGTFSYAYIKDEKVWVNDGKAAEFGDDDYFDVLRMKPDGITSEAPIGLTGNLYPGSYQEMINFFTKDNWYTLNQDLFIFPYDWRLDISHTKPLLDAKIQQIKQQTGSPKVDIVAHSMGGLVARNYIADPEKAVNVRKLLTLGTPHLGSVKTFQNLLFGGCMTREILKNLPVCLGIDPVEVKDVLQNLISGYQLAPSQNYFNFYDGSQNNPLPYKYNSNLLSYSQIKNLLSSSGYNTSLFTHAENFHTLDNTLANTNGVDITIIAGSSEPTLGQIIEYTRTSLTGTTIIHKEQKIVNGDGTVPLFSASINDPNRNLSLSGNANVYYSNQEHSNLVSNGAALNLAKNILSGKTELPENVSTSPYPLPLLYRIFSVHSPVNIHVYDSNGNHTGLTATGDIETNIPGSKYDTLGDAKFVYVPEEGVYDIKFEATDQGAFDFKIRKFETEENTETILYKDIPLTASTKAQTTFDTSFSQPPNLSVDENGDEVVDFNVSHFSILEGDANHDYTSPTISFDVDPKTLWSANHKTVDINITGTITDENPYFTTIMVKDEYGLVEPSVTIYDQTEINQKIQLESSRKGTDKDGRSYKITILVTDLAGNTALQNFEVIVPHDQRNKK